MLGPHGRPRAWRPCRLDESSECCGGAAAHKGGRSAGRHPCAHEHWDTRPRIHRRRGCRLGHGGHEAVDLDAPWEQAAPNLRLALPRRRPLPSGMDDLASQVYPPGIRTLLTLDIGPALLFVRQDQLGAWGISADRGFQRAIRNARNRVRLRRHFALLHERIRGVPAVAFQSREGWASALLLGPDELCHVLGERDGLILAPMRDLIIRLPPDADPTLALRILDEFAAADINALDLPPFRLVDGQLSSVGTGAPSSMRVTGMH